MTSVQEIESLHIEHRLEGLSESFVFKPATYATYGAARRAMKDLIGGYTGLSLPEKQIVCRWSLINDQQELDFILKSDEQSRVYAFHNSHIKTMHSESYKEVSLPYYSSVTKEIIYDGTRNSEILSINVASKGNVSGDSYSVRLYDVKNSKVVAEKTGLTNLEIDIIDLGTILYQPTIKTVLKLQLKKDSGIGYISSSSYELLFL